MIPCKMPEEASPTLTDTIELLQKAHDTAKELADTEYDQDCLALYRKLEKDISRLVNKAEQIKSQADQKRSC